MKPLSGLDGAFLHLETPATPMHVASLHLFDLPAGASQGARTTGEWSLLGCQVTPAWEEAEFALGQQEELLRVFPAHAAIIRTLTR